MVGAVRRFLFSLCIGAFVASAAASAQQSGTALPGDRVGRVSFVEGSVSWRGAAANARTDAVANEPVAAGAALRTAAPARAEIEIGADTVDLAEGTEIEIARLDDRMVEIAVPQGRVEIVLRQPGDGENVEIDVPRGGVWLQQPGRYDIDAGGQDRPLRISVFAGRARFAGGGTDIGVKAGDAAVVAGTGPAAATTEPASPDAFADWCRERDWDETKLAAPYFVSPNMTGFDALDAAGDWQHSDEYGEVWFPTSLPADWAPYRQGRWNWVPPWGWTWIDDQPWGFAPSHYGRWALFGQRWGWVLGGFVADPVYAPALVAFLGTPGIGLSYAEGTGPAIGWFPLAPGETYRPGYTGDLDYIRRLNRGSVADLDAIRAQAGDTVPLEIVNRHFADRLFASVVPRPVFAGGLPVMPALLELPAERLQNAPVVMGSPQIGPPPAAAHAPAPVAAAASKDAVAAKAVNFAALRSHGVHLRAPGYAAPPHPQRIVILQLARAVRAPAHPAAHKKETRR